jgi:hypothetical protein
MPDDLGDDLGDLGVLTVLQSVQGVIGWLVESTVMQPMFGL